MSQQVQGRAYFRHKDDPALKTYTGKVMLIFDPEIGQNGKERPRGVKISDSPESYEGKTFRCWAWKEEEFNKLVVGQWVTVFYEEEPSNTPGRRGSNAISIVEPATAPGGGQAGGGGEVTAGQSAPQPTSQPEMSRDDYWAKRDETDLERQLQIEAAWAIKVVMERQDPDEKMTSDQIIEKALQFVILKRQLASELGHG